MSNVAAARQAFADHQWARAHALLREADEASALDPEDLELLSSTARWSGVPQELVEPLERAFAAYCSEEASCAAARVALALC